VLVPSGSRADGAGAVIDFDAVYDNLLRPAIEMAEMEPLRADDELAGIYGQQVFERFMLCEYAVADVTTASAGVLYGIGIRHAARPASTVLAFAAESGPPFDVAPLLSVPYALADGRPAAIEADAAALCTALEAARTASPDTPLYELVEDLRRTEITRLRTDVFRDRVRYSAVIESRLATARDRGAAAVASVHAELGNIGSIDFAVLIDLLLSYRAVRAWDEMIGLVAQFPTPLARSVMVQEQLALALNRAGRGEEAEEILLGLIEERGATGETNSILGRVYKDRWDRAEDDVTARADLAKAIDAYTAGFEADWRDAYPGVNAVTLMELSDPPDPRRHAMIPVVRYSSERRVAAGQPDYWDHAALLELAVLDSDAAAASLHCAAAVAEVREVWEPETTIRNMNLIRAARAERNEPVAWLVAIIATLEEKMQSLTD
jgi:hypothetical protein